MTRLIRTTILFTGIGFGIVALNGCNSADLVDSSPNSSGKGQNQTAKKPDGSGEPVPESGLNPDSVANGGQPVVDGAASQPPAATLPGVKVLKVGINMEDQRSPGSDADYNDIVMCFTGSFNIDGQNVISNAVQSVSVATSSISGCRHTVTANVKHADGSSEPALVFDSRDTAAKSLKFKVGSKLIITAVGCGSYTYDTVSPAWTKMLPDQCNTTGN